MRHTYPEISLLVPSCSIICFLEGPKFHQIVVIGILLEAGFLFFYFKLNPV